VFYKKENENINIRSLSMLAMKRIDIYILKTLLEKIVAEINEAKDKEDAKQRILRILSVVNDFAQRELERDLLLLG